MNSKVIVTLAIGERYLQYWRQACEANWRAYAARHGFDVICIDKPLDDSERARKRTASWQKCLILSQDFAQRYERIVWIDSDILINHHAAPAIDAGVPLEKVGAVEEFTFAHDAGSYPHLLLDRLYAHWGKSVINYVAEQYYTNYGLPNGFDKVVQTGVMVLSPRHHRALLENVYHSYEEKGGAEWHYEMRPLSYELLKANVVHWIDPRFNLMWAYEMFLHYPFLIQQKANVSYSARVKRKLAVALGAPSFASLQQTCLTTTFLDSFFFHMGGSGLEQMTQINQAATSIADCIL